MNRETDFNTIYREFHTKILKYISRLTSHTDAEDIMQEVFEKANRGLETFRGESSLSIWLYRIATNTVLDKLKSSSFIISHEEFDPETEDGDSWIGHKINRVGCYSV